MNQSVSDARLHFRQEDAAMHQLVRAINLFLEERDFLCAITLAGAADGILGEILHSREQPPAIESHVMAAISAEPTKIEEKKIGNDLNLARNLLKHKKRHEQVQVSLAAETEAIYVISRAIDNSVRLGNEIRPPVPTFIDWVYKNRPDLIGQE